jgi:hypothetical protein
MKNTNWKDIAELVAIAAVVASLVFVGMQMRQDRLLARAALGAGSFESLASLRLEMTEPDFAATYAKALERPEQLTTAEKLQVNAYLDAFVYLIVRDCYLKDREVFVECEIIVREYGPIFFGNRYAQLWWQIQDRKKMTFLPNWVDAEISAIDPEANLRRLQAIQEE